MRRLRALIMGLPPDSAARRHQPTGETTEQIRPRSTSSLDAIRKAGGKVIEIQRAEAS